MTDPDIAVGHSRPHIAAAFFCERLIEDKDGVLTVVRIVDRITHTAVGSGTPQVMPPVPVNLTLLVSFKSGDARGRHELSVYVEAPSGLRETVVSGVSVLFEGEDRGNNSIFNLSWVAGHEGLYWFDVLLDGSRVTRVPLRISYQRQETGRSQPSPGHS